MTISQRLLLVNTVLATGVLAFGYAQSGWWALSALVAAVGFLWLLGGWQGWGWIGSISLVLFVCAAGAGMLAGSGAGWMLLGLVATLAAWDLGHFVQRLQEIERVEGQDDLEQRHLRRLLIVAGLGLPLAGVALTVSVEFGLGVALILGLVAVFGLSQVVAYLRHESGSAETIF